MKKITGILLLPFVLMASSPFVEDGTANIPTNEVQPTQQRNVTLDLKAIQKSFLKGENGNSKSILNIYYKHNNTYRIKTRQTMQTLIILDNDTIAGEPFYGDKAGFKVTPLKKGKYDFSNMLIVEPILNGVDTNLTIIGESGKIYSFYLYSTDYKSKSNPDLVVFVSSDREQIGQIEIEDLEAKNFQKEKKAQETMEKTKDLKNVMIIGEGINQLKIKLDEIVRNEYVQDGEKKLAALEIFRDKHFTYFKYNNNSALFKFPIAYKVADGFDTPVKQRIVGNYLIVETIADGYTLRLGDQHVCVRKMIKDE